MKIRDLFALLVLSIYSTFTHSHAVVTHSSFKVKPIHANQASIVHLDFNSKIELGLSQVFLVSTGDQQTLLNLSKGEKAGQLQIAIPKLTSGDYALKLKVFAADGHLTEDVIHFTVTP